VPIHGQRRLYPPEEIVSAKVKQVIQEGAALSPSAVMFAVVIVVIALSVPIGVFFNLPVGL
jgi:hypothetical protein